MRKRIWELDFVRGISILGVVAYHVAYDLQYIYRKNLSGNWVWMYQFGAVFIILAGVSSVFSKDNFARGMKLLAIAMMLTLVTYLYNPNDFIQFGILHLLAVCILAYQFFLNKLKNTTLMIIGFLTIALGLWFSSIVSPWPHLYILGLRDRQFQSIDHFPVFPWAGYFLLGIPLARIVYRKKESIFKKTPGWVRPFCFLGRHSLLIYLIHQPVILLILNLVFYRKIW